MIKLQVRNSVLMEQDMQRYQHEHNDNVCCNNPEILAKISQRLSLPSREEAYERGLNDAKGCNSMQQSC